MGKSWKEGRGKWDKFDKRAKKIRKDKKSKGGGKPKETESFEEQW